MRLILEEINDQQKKSIYGGCKSHECKGKS